MSLTTRVADKAGVVGTSVSSFGYAACFPAAAQHRTLAMYDVAQALGMKNVKLASFH